MDADPTASIPWAFHTFVSRIEELVRTSSSSTKTDTMETQPEQAILTDLQPGIGPKNKLERLLVLLSQISSDRENLMSHMEYTSRQLSTALTSARNKGYVKPGSLALTDAGKEHAQSLITLSKNAKKEGLGTSFDLTLRYKIREYIKTIEGKGEIPYKDVYQAFPDENKASVASYLSSYKNGATQLDGFEIGGRKGKISVTKTARYAGPVNSIELVYAEDPELADILGGHTEFHPELIIVRNSIPPEKTGVLYRALKRVPDSDHEPTTAYRDMLGLFTVDPAKGLEFIEWVTQQNNLTATQFYDKLDFYRTATHGSQSAAA
ncbi:MAG: hypothetical protein HY051_00025 [Candidatus Aenigmarchaeota archaeon]|nr:hypothetical protein [Candidatus Aenigmarchaeota archaeon]